MVQNGKNERYYMVDDDVHTLCIGATRSGKSRSVVLQSIGIQALAGESMVMSDPKSELFNYTYPFLERLGYDVIPLDFKNPLKSRRYNFLQNVIEAFRDGNTAKAIDYTWDITESLVGNKSKEPMWDDGTKSTIAAGILSVVYDNMDKPQYQNLTNVYFFLSEMCRTVGNQMPINGYLKQIAPDHPAKALLGISEVAPSKTRGSFFTAALTTLRLFTNPLIYSMTCETDFDYRATGREKQAVFLILPDEKETYYSLASLFTSQHYETLVNEADKRGGRLERRVNFNLDEFGNYAQIPGFSTKLTVGGGRGIRFNLYIQSLSQLDEKYDKENAKTIKSNCQTWIYLQADETETLEEISKKLGNYTVATNSRSSSYSYHSNSSESASVNLTARALLTPDEVRMINRPYSLIISRSHPCILYAPDISKTNFNAMFGMGDKEYNRQLQKQRDEKRPARPRDIQMELWGIWNKYNGTMDKYMEDFTEDGAFREKMFEKFKKSGSRMVYERSVEDD
ncbi:MAG: type IV secretory system conjugative DNA transfer family protein [Oscillospiraceae bacterium]|jgi:type IV secretion system protein VirD4|nr:type IV secretory system conjugative DNA transfer family protein [Oscillospiraceae bacterium]